MTPLRGSSPRSQQFLPSPEAPRAPRIPTAIWESISGQPMNHAVRLKRLSIIVAIALLWQSAAADTAPPAPSGCSAAEYHQLDFWIGDWDTFESDSPGGASVARARVDPIAQGCAIHELYEQEDGLIGDSILSYDPVLKKWQQTWVTNRGSIMVLTGNFSDGTLVLEGDAHLMDGRSVMQRITWKTQGDGVRESAVLSKDGGATWTPAFDVLFRKRTKT
jgi:hypothetical protein